MLEMVFSNKSRKEVFSKVGELENKGIKELNNGTSNILLANEISNKKVFKDSIKSVAYLILCFILAILMMVVTGNSGCNYVLFHFAIYFASYKAFSDMLTNLSERSNKLKAECEFFDDCNL